MLHRQNDLEPLDSVCITCNTFYPGGVPAGSFCIECKTYTVVPNGCLPEKGVNVAIESLPIPKRGWHGAESTDEKFAYGLRTRWTYTRAAQEEALPEKTS
ncbi:MAG: hypothetical protein AMXMBFR44_4980 [Candidatus Campbellbacteria bacterium]